MRQLAPLLVLATTFACQSTLDEQVPAPRKLPPFPQDTAKWVIGGQVKCDAIPGKTVELTRIWQDTMQSFRVPPFRCNPTNLGLSGVVVRVAGLHTRWRFPLSRDCVRMRLTFPEDILADDAVPRAVALVAGGMLELEKSPTRPLSFRYGHGRQFVHFAKNEVRMGLNAPGIQFASWAGADMTFLVPAPYTLKLTAQSGRVHVLPHPIFALTDGDGRFVLPALPPGDYELVATHEQLGKITRSITIQGRDPSPLTIGTTHYAGDRQSAALLPLASAVRA